MTERLDENFVAIFQMPEEDEREKPVFFFISKLCVGVQSTQANYTLSSFNWDESNLCIQIHLFGKLIWHPTRH